MKQAQAMPEDIADLREKAKSAEVHKISMIMLGSIFVGSCVRRQYKSKTNRGHQTQARVPACYPDGSIIDWLGM